MSSTIIYHAVGMTLPSSLTGLDQDTFLIAAQVGESNCYEISRGGGPGRRSRSWSALHWGTENCVIEDAIRLGGSFEGGWIHLDHYRGYASPEQYIRRCRRLLNEARGRRASSIQFKGECVYAVPLKRTPRPGSSWAMDDESFEWHDPRTREMLSGALAEKPRPYNLFRVSGPELRR